MLSDLERDLFLESMDVGIDYVRGLQMMCVGLIATATTPDTQENGRALYRQVNNILEWMQSERVRLAGGTEGVAEGKPLETAAEVIH